MFNFSANLLILLSRTECERYVVFVMKDDSTQRVYRLHDFTKSRIITPAKYYCVSGKVNREGRRLRCRRWHQKLCDRICDRGAGQVRQLRPR
jgi:hypothetical protein